MGKRIEIAIIESAPLLERARARGLPLERLASAVRGARHHVRPPAPGAAGSPDPDPEVAQQETPPS